MQHSASKTIVITGATRGLGLAMVESMARLGHSIHGCGRSHTHIGDLQTRFPDPHTFRTVDSADAMQVKGWIDAILEGNGPPDLVVNNAALMNRNAHLWELSESEFDAVIDVNIKGVFYVMKHVLPSMIAAKRGVIVNFSSGWGRSTSPLVAPYCATKFAIEGLTAALAQELPAGMAAISLNPGVIATDMLQTCFGADARSYPTARQWAKRAVPFILGLDASHNGKSLDVPG